MSTQSNGPEENTPGPYPVDQVEKVTLRDGTELVIRPIRPDDAALLQEGFRRLSPQSIYLRFLETFKELSDRQAQRFSVLDYQDHMAFVAELEENGKNSLIGVARYSMLADEPGVAESAIVVGDEFQGRGLGLLLLARLIRYAQTHGVTTFLATVHLSNNKIMRFIHRGGFAFSKKMIEPGVWEVRIHLDQPVSSNTPQE